MSTVYSGMQRQIRRWPQDAEGRLNGPLRVGPFAVDVLVRVRAGASAKSLAAQLEFSSTDPYVDHALPQVKTGAAATAVPAGVFAPDQPATIADDSAAYVRVVGVCACAVDGSGTAIAIGDQLELAASGKLVKLATSGAKVAAIALAAASTATSIDVLLRDPANLLAGF